MLISYFVLGVKSKTYLVLMTSIHTHLSPNYTTCCLKIVQRRVAKVVDCWRTTINNDYLLKPPCVLMFWQGKQHCPFHFAAPGLHIKLYRATHELYTKALIVLVYFLRTCCRDSFTYLKYLLEETYYHRGLNGLGV